MDIRMPGMSGLEAIKQISAVESVPQPVIITVTASVFEEDRKAILAADCTDFIRKPLREKELFESIGQHLKIRYTYEQEKSAVQQSELAPEKIITPERLAILSIEGSARGTGIQNSYSSRYSYMVGIYPPDELNKFE